MVVRGRPCSEPSFFPYLLAADMLTTRQAMQATGTKEPAAFARLAIHAGCAAPHALQGMELVPQPYRI